MCINLDIVLWNLFHGVYILAMATKYTLSIIYHYIITLKPLSYIGYINKMLLHGSEKRDSYIAYYLIHSHNLINQIIQFLTIFYLIRST